MAYPYRVDATGRTARPAGPDEHARQLIEQVLVTAPGERVLRPDLGTGVHQLVFAPTGDQAAAAVQQLVSGALQKWLAGWVTVTGVEVVGGADSLEVAVRYVVAETGDSGSTTLAVGR
jgi:phage baseplate assembly protein W